MTSVEVGIALDRQKGRDNSKARRHLDCRLCSGALIGAMKEAMRGRRLKQEISDKKTPSTQMQKAIRQGEISQIIQLKKIIGDA